MSTRGMQTLVATALTDPQRKDLLLSQSPGAYDGFDLSAEELAELRAIQARTLEEFALHAHRLFYGEDLSLPDSLPIGPWRARLAALDCA